MQQIQTNNERDGIGMNVNAWNAVKPGKRWHSRT